MTNKNDNAKSRTPSQSSNGERHSINDSGNPASNRNGSNEKSGPTITQNSMTPPRPGSNPNKK